MKALLVSYHFPPDGVIGSVRPHQLARYLPEFGIEPWILTVYPEFAEQVHADRAAEGVPEERILRTGVGDTAVDGLFRLWRVVAGRTAGAKGGVALPDGDDRESRQGRVRRLAGLRDRALSWLLYPDPKVGWFRPAVRMAERLLQEEKLDVLISTSPPRVAALIAYEIHRRHGIPWVMDLRDPWQMSWDRQRTPAAVRGLLGRLFRRCVQSADLIVHNTERLRRFTCQLVPDVTAKTCCVPNGFESGWAQTGWAGRPAAFSLGYYGNMMGRRSAAAFLEGLRRWMAVAAGERSRVAVQFVGSGFEETEAYAAALGLREMIRFLPPVSRAEVRGRMAGDFVLLLLANEQPLQVPGKAYDYLATGRRILAVTERDSACADLMTPLAGCAVVERPEQVASALASFHSEFVRGADPLIDRTTLLSEGQYRNRAAQFADLVYSVAGPNAPGRLD